MKQSMKMLGLHIFLAGKHLIRIAANGIDLTIVYNKTVGMRSLPAGIGIG